MSYHEEEVLGKAYDSRLMARLLAYLRPYKIAVATAFVLIVAISRNDQIIIPHGDETIYVGDVLYAVADRNSVRNVLAYLRREEEPVRRVLIAGGSPIGFEVARELQRAGVSVRLVEPDSERCQGMAETLEKALILQGEITDQALLKEEGIEDQDFFISTSDDEDANILASLLAKRLGAKKTITLVRHLHYLSVLPTIGIDAVVSPRLSATDKTFPFLM